MGKGSGDVARPAIGLDPSTSRPSRARPSESRHRLHEAVAAARRDGTGSVSELSALVDESGLGWDDVRDPAYDPDLHLALAVTAERSRASFEGVETRAIAHRAVSLEEIADGLTGSSTVVVGDVHGDVDLFEETLSRLGILRDGERRFDGTVVQLGDLVDGRRARDVECLARGLEWCDAVIAGNHEAAYLGGPSFSEQPVRDDLATDLRRALWNPKLRVGHVAAGVLLTHAGAVTDLEDPEEALSVIDEHWAAHCGRPRARDPLLFGIDGFRGGGASVGGVLWGDWRGRLARATGFTQIVGHTPLGLTEHDPTGRWHGIDLAGPRLGVAVIDEGRITVAHSMLMRP